MYIEITSSHGSVHSDETGHVVATNLAADFGPVPVYINWPAWYKAYPGEKLPAAVDILDVGYITGDGTYVEPCEDWREDLLIMKNARTEPTNWWFNVVTGAVTERRGHRLFDELEVTAEYANYLARRPEGVWELRKPEDGDTVCSLVCYLKYRASSHTASGNTPDDLGYRWCMPRAAETAVNAATAAKSAVWDVYDVEEIEGYYYVIGLEPTATTLAWAMSRVGFDGTQFAEQSDRDTWVMGTVAYVDKRGAISGVYYAGCKPATPVRVRCRKATT